MWEYLLMFVVMAVCYSGYLYYDYKRKESQLQQIPTVKVGQVNPEHLDYDKLPIITVDELHKFDGKKDPKVYVAIKNVVFDVSSSDSYKPDGAYGVFAGQDASIALGKMDLSGQHLNEYGKVTQPSEEVQIMNDWAGYFYQRYPVIAKIEDKKSQ